MGRQAAIADLPGPVALDGPLEAQAPKDRGRDSLAAIERAEAAPVSCKLKIERKRRGSGDPSGLQNRRELASLALVSSTLTRFRHPRVPSPALRDRDFGSRFPLG